MLLFSILFYIIQNERFRNKPGVVTGVFLTLYGLFRGFIELFREPDSQIGLIMEAVSMGQLLSLPMVVAGSGFVIYALRKSPVLKR